VLTLTLQFATPEALSQFLITNYPPINVPAPRPVVAIAPGGEAGSTPAASGAGTPPPADPEKKKPGRPKKADAPVTPPAGAVAGTTPPAASPAGPATPAASAITEAEVRAELMKVNDKFGADGLGKVAEVLQPFGVTHIRDLKPEQFAQVIEAARKAAA
jgi:hypothetical protein